MSDIREYSDTVKLLRDFFQGELGFTEVHTQSRLSILAACEDPTTLSAFNFAGNVWPLPQTGQMWLEYELLKNPKEKGVFCISTSYRNEPNPIPGRHLTIFPMFEFEFHGGIDNLESVSKDLLEFMGFGKKDKFPGGHYDDVAKKYGVTELKAEHEGKIYQDFGSVFFLKSFPNYTSPFWNMKRAGKHSNKIDVIMAGMETIGSAEREVDTNVMRDSFHTISNGAYAETLYSTFGKERVEKELEDFLSLDMFERCGGGIGVSRMINALKKINLL